jgi:hypothetical protein
MYKIDGFNKSDLLFILECRGLNSVIVFNDTLVIYRDGQIVFSKFIKDLFVNDLVDLGINVCDDRYVHYLVDIARDNSKGKRKSLTL